MRVKAVRSFAGRTREGTFQVSAGDEFDLPDGVDWLRAGFVVPVRSKPVERAVRKAPEKALEIDATDSARELAESANLALSSVAGTGAGGRIVKADVEKLLKEED